MKNRRNLVLVLIVFIIVQLSCASPQLDPAVIRKTVTAGAQSTQTTFAITASASYAEDCDAYSLISIEAVITEEAQYDTWRSCQYYLTVTNNHDTQDVWLWLHTFHATEDGIDRDEWNSATVEAGTFDEWAFGGDFNNNGSFGHSYVSEITAILAIPECNDMRRRTNAITLARPVEWFCGP